MLVDFEVGGGRTGLADVAEAVALAKLIEATEGAEYAGVQGYDGGFQNLVEYTKPGASANSWGWDRWARCATRCAMRGFRPRS